MNSYRNWRNTSIQNAYTNSHWADTRLGPVRYTDVGTGFPIIHSHGSPTSCDSGVRAWKIMAERLGARLITPARPGFLGTPLSVGASIEQQADMFVALMDSLNVDQAILHSWSSGGPSAIRAAARYPDRFKGLILYSSLAHGWDYRLSILDRLMMKDWGIWLVQRSRAKKTEAFHRMICKGTGWDYPYLKEFTESRMLLDTFFDFMTPASIRNEGSLNDIRNFVNMADLHMEEIKIPTLIIFSPENKKLPYSHAKTAHHGIKGSKLINYTHGAHFFLVDPRSGFLMEEMLRFIQQC